MIGVLGSDGSIRGVMERERRGGAWLGHGGKAEHLAARPCVGLGFVTEPPRTTSR